MGYRKHRSAIYIADEATVTQAATFSSAASVANLLTCSSAISVESTAALSGHVNTSTSVVIGGAQIVPVGIHSCSATITQAGGMLVLASSDATASTYTLPVSTAGTVYYIYFSSGPDSGDPGASAAGVTVRGTSMTFASLASSVAGDGKTQMNKLIGTTGDHFIICAMSSSQWNVLSYSTNAATSSGA